MVFVVVAVVVVVTAVAVVAAVVVVAVVAVHVVVPRRIMIVGCHLYLHHRGSERPRLGINGAKYSKVVIDIFGDYSPVN